MGVGLVRAWEILIKRDISGRSIFDPDNYLPPIGVRATRGRLPDTPVDFPGKSVSSHMQRDTADSKV